MKDNPFWTNLTDGAGAQQPAALFAPYSESIVIIIIIIFNINIFVWVCISFQSWSLFWCLILCTKLIFGPILGKNGTLYPHQELSQHHEQYENVVFWVSRHDGNTKIGRFAQKNDFEPKRATLGYRGQETARRAAKRPSTGKPKVSRVTSRYGGHVISPVRCVWPQKLGVS